MRDILLILLCGIFMVGVMVLSLNMAKGPGLAENHGTGFGAWFWKLTHIQQAEQDAQIIGDARRENDSKLKNQKDVLDDKTDQARHKMEMTEDRIRAMQERNDDQKARLEAQMERMKNR